MTTWHNEGTPFGPIVLQGATGIWLPGTGFFPDDSLKIYWRLHSLPHCYSSAPFSNHPGESLRLIRAPQDKTQKLQAQFLQGKTKINMSDINNHIITFIYSHWHRHSAPSSGSTSVMHLQISLHLFLTPKSSTRILLYSLGQRILLPIMFAERSTKILVRSTTPTSGLLVGLVLCERYKAHAPVSWCLAESMAASHKNCIIILKKQRPHLIITLLISI